MTPLLILTHGELGATLLKAAEGMYGPQAGVQSLGLGPDETREDFAARVQAAQAELKAPPLVLVDLACGTPWNVAVLQGCATQGEVLSGVNLPLLLEALGLRDSLGPLDLAKELLARLPQAFLRASELIAQGKSGSCE